MGDEWIDVNTRTVEDTGIQLIIEADRGVGSTLDEGTVKVITVIADSENKLVVLTVAISRAGHQANVSLLR